MDFLHWSSVFYEGDAPLRLGIVGGDDACKCLFEIFGHTVNSIPMLRNERKSNSPRKVVLVGTSISLPNRNLNAFRLLPLQIK